MLAIIKWGEPSLMASAVQQFSNIAHDVATDLSSSQADYIRGIIGI